VGETETVASTWAISGGAVLASNISENLDFTLSYNGTVNLGRNALTVGSNGDYYTHTAGLRLNVITWEGVTLREELNHALSSGVAEGYDQNVALWNSSVGKKLLKDGRGELRLTANDVLGQGKSTRRTVTESYVQDQRNRTLGRYVMLTFTYTLR